MAYLAGWDQWGIRMSAPGEELGPAIPGAKPYTRFNSGITWDQVRAELKREQNMAKAKGQYMFVSRGTVLGRLRQRKQEAYGRYLAHVQALEEGLPF